MKFTFLCWCICGYKGFFSFPISIAADTVDCRAALVIYSQTERAVYGVFWHCGDNSVLSVVS